MNKGFFLWVLVFPLLSWAVENPSEIILQEEEGFFLCGGGTQVALFAKDCQKLSLTRVVTPGGIKYEGNCLDSNGKAFYLVCDTVSFEYAKRASDKSDTYWKKSKKSPSP